MESQRGVGVTRCFQRFVYERKFQLVVMVEWVDALADVKQNGLEVPSEIIYSYMWKLPRTLHFLIRSMGDWKNFL